MPYYPQRGDIVVIHLDIPKNHEFADRHHAVCLSMDNEGSNVALFCPLTNDKGHNVDVYAVEIPPEFTGKKSWALVRQIKSLDWNDRKVQKSVGKLDYAYVKTILNSLADWTGSEY